MASLEATLDRLRQERDDADRRYNEALTALDQAVPRLTPPPPATAPFDATQIANLNAAWNILPDPPAAAGMRGRLAGFVWRTIAPYLQRQQNFNASLVDHLNRTIAAAEDSKRTADERAAHLREQLGALAAFHARIVHYLQQVTAYVDTRDRAAASGDLVLNAALSGIAETADKRWESFAGRDRRLEARVLSLSDAQEELHTLVGISQHAAAAIKREIETLAAAPSGAAPAREPQPTPSAPAGGQVFRSLDSYKYVGFEDQFRGSRDEIRSRLESYLPFFAGASDVLDVGCGRGEFLELLAAAGVTARGLDTNREMVEQCRTRGLDVVEADAAGYLASLPDQSLGGVFAAQVVEHLEPDYLLRFLELAYHKIRPGGRVVLETLNPACWVAFFESYLRDITHVWPLHPETLKYLVLCSGFSRAGVEYRSAIPEQDRLASVAAPATAEPWLRDMIETLNANSAKLNSRIYTHLDYAVIGSR